MSHRLTARITEGSMQLPGQDAPRPAWRLELTDADGHKGCGLAAPLPGFSAEGGDEVKSCLDRLVSDGAPPLASVDDLLTVLEDTSWPPSVAHAVEQAALEMLASRGDTSPRELLEGQAGPTRHHALVRDGWSAQLAVARGVAALKIKVGGGDDPLRVVREVRQAVGPQMRLHVDANGHWTPDQARHLLGELEGLGVALVEEPVAGRDLAMMAELRRGTTVSLAADESCRSAGDLDAIIALQAADAVVLKPMLIGGAMKTAALARRASEAGMSVILTHCFDGPLGQASVMLAAALTPPEALCTVAALAPEDATLLPHPLAAAAAARPEHPAVTFEGETLTYAELADRASRFATHLREQGVRQGDVVGLRAPIDLSWVVAFHGITWLGGVAAPLCPRPASDDTLEAQRSALRPRLILEPEMLTARPTEAPCPAASWRLDAPTVALFTSGTSGTPRGTFLTGTQLVCSAMGSRARLGHTPDDRWLCCLPLHHIGGLSILLRSALNRTTVLLEGAFDAARIARRLRADEATTISLVPTMLSRVLDAAEGEGLGQRLRTVLLGGAAAPPALLARSRALGVPIARTWGMTETASQVATAPPGDDRPGLAPLPLVAVSAPEGVLIIEGPLAGVRPLTTADRGWVAEDGRVHVAGRIDQIIISGGENLDGARIEAALRRHPDVAEACVVAVPDATWGQRPGACLVAARAEVRPRIEQLREAFTQHLPKHAFPDWICWLDALPRTALGKVSRRRVAEHLVGAQGVSESVGHGQGREGGHVDAGVDMAGRGPDQPIGSALDGEFEGDRGLAEAPDGDLDGELLAHAHGPLEVGLGVDQGHPPVLGVEDLAQGVVLGGEEALVGGVAVLEDTAEKGDPGAIDLVEPHDQSMFERHKNSGRRTP